MKSPLFVYIFCAAFLGPAETCLCDSEHREDEGQEFLFLLDEAYLQYQGQWQVEFQSEYLSGKKTIEGDEKTKQSMWQWTAAAEYGLTDWLQFEIEVPFASVYRKTIDDGEITRLEKAGIADIETSLKLRLFEEQENELLSPMISAVFSINWPSGSWRRGLGCDVYGFGWGLCFSKTMENWAYHINVELGIANDAREAGESATSDSTGFELGGAVVRSLSDRLDLACELLAEFEREKSSGSEEHETEVMVSPGIIYELAEDLQVGIAVPIGLTSESYNYGITAKLQYEW